MNNTYNPRFIGELPFRMTNDLLFKFLLQENSIALSAIISSFMEIPQSAIRHMNIVNPITLADDYVTKEMILDVKVELNDDAIINIEMQVLNNPDTGVIYSSKFKLSVVDLTLREKATRQDKKYHRDLWAAFFKSTSWEELYMLAEKDESINSAVLTVEQFAENERLKHLAHAHEEWLLVEKDFQGYFSKEIAEKDAEIAMLKAELEQLKSNK